MFETYSQKTAQDTARVVKRIGELVESTHLLIHKHSWEPDDEGLCLTCTRENQIDKMVDEAENPCKMNQVFYRGPKAYCELDGKSWTEHVCTRCRNNSRRPGWSYCTECSETYAT